MMIVVLRSMSSVVLYSNFDFVARKLQEYVTDSFTPNHGNDNMWGPSGGAMATRRADSSLFTGLGTNPTLRYTKINVT